MRHINENVRFDGLILIIILVYWAACSLIWQKTSLPNITYISIETNALLLFLGLILYVSIFWLYHICRYFPDKPIGYTIELYRSHDAQRRIVYSLPILLGFSIFFPIFSSMKSCVGIYTDYPFDVSFIYLDKFIHGTDPWRILTPIIETPVAIFLTTFFYHAWITLLYIGFPLICLDWKRPELRFRFILATLLGWTLVGNVLAIALASGGPAFEQAIHGNAHFLPLMNALQESDKSLPVLTLDVQQMLLKRQMDASNGLGSGISAMPSMHVFFAFLFVLWAREVGKIPRNIFAAFFVIILIGSVATGYHYAVDGYVSILCAVVLWWFSGVVASRIAWTSYKSIKEHL